MVWTLFMFLTVFAVSKANDEIQVFPSNGYGIEGESFEVIATTVPFKSCIFQHTVDPPFVVNETGTNDSNLNYWQNEDASSCKLIVKSMGAIYKGQWLVNITSEDGNVMINSFKIGQFDTIQPSTAINETGLAGTRFSKYCVSSEVPVVFAKIYNAQNTLVYEGVSPIIDIPYLKKSDSGTWRCVLVLENTMKEISVDFVLEVKEEETIEPSVNESEDEVFLLCKHKKVIPSPPCLFEFPNETVIAPLEGVVMGRYKYYGNDITEECGLAIKKPLEEEEKGVWRCLITSKDHSRTLLVGVADINVNGSTNNPKVAIITGMNLTIGCQLRRPIRYCFAISPTGQTFSAYPTAEQSGFYSGRGLGLGDCQLTIPGNQTSVNDTGMWFCGMGPPDQDDILIPVAVTIAASNFSSMESNLKASEGDALSLGCHSVMGYSLNYCRFTHPSGRSINVQTISRNERYSVVKQDINTGVCRLEIVPVNSDDFGTWTCAAGISEAGVITEYQDVIIVEPYPISSSMIIGFSIGLGLVIGGAVVGFVFWERTKQRRRVSVLNVGTMQWERQRRRTSETSSNSSNLSRNSLVFTR